ncbi:hypothetical protein ACSDR0_27400 [Streptosporangium sp. G11]|uniref:hypothetical protein n=1 Tax=Streptosporangium sp. G11 TaxID=3436926 RepID=UPI003EBC474B
MELNRFKCAISLISPSSAYSDSVVALPFEIQWGKVFCPATEKLFQKEWFLCVETDVDDLIPGLKIEWRLRLVKLQTQMDVPVVQPGQNGERPRIDIHQSVSAAHH